MSDKETRLAELREVLDSDVLYLISRHRTPNNATEFFDAYATTLDETSGEIHMRRLTFSISEACGLTYNRKHEAFAVRNPGYSCKQWIEERVRSMVGIPMRCEVL